VSQRKMLTWLAVFLLVMVGGCISEYGDHLPIAGFGIWVKLLGMSLVMVSVGYWGIDNIVSPEPAPARCPWFYWPPEVMAFFGVLALLFSFFLLYEIVRTLLAL
jgi:hypothetical protein